MTLIFCELVTLKKDEFHFCFCKPKQAEKSEFNFLQASNRSKKMN